MFLLPCFNLKIQPDLSRIWSEVDGKRKVLHGLRRNLLNSSKKFIQLIVQEKWENKFMRLPQGVMTVTEYETQFTRLQNLHLKWWRMEDI